MRKKILVAVLAMSLCTGTALAMRPVTIAEQGSFFAGGKVLETTGEFDYTHPLAPQGQTLHGDHAYVFYQKPLKAKRLPLVFLHGAGQSAKTWETTPDGRDGFQNIFLSRRYSTYLVDQPRRGKAGRTTLPGSIDTTTNDQFWFSNFRVGNWPNYFDGVQFAKDEETLNQYLRQITPNTGAYDEAVVSDAMAAVFAKAGDGILVTHSQGGGPGWRTVIKSEKVRAVISFEPGSSFPFPKGDAPEPLATTSPTGALSAAEIPLADFMKLTKIPIVIFYGDNIADSYTQEWNKDSWRIRLTMARLWAEAVNKHGGDVTVIHLPEIGIKGNTHFPMSDLNNTKVADVMEKWMQEKGLSK